jgi:hypothetical protein
MEGIPGITERFSGRNLLVKLGLAILHGGGKGIAEGLPPLEGRFVVTVARASWMGGACALSRMRVPRVRSSSLES